MVFPALRGSGQYNIKIPVPGGGLNTFDRPDGIEDNQLSDVKNMWHRGGLLRARPGIKPEGDAEEAVNGQNIFTNDSEATALSTSVWSDAGQWYLGWVYRWRIGHDPVRYHHDDPAHTEPPIEIKAQNGGKPSALVIPTEDNKMMVLCGGGDIVGFRTAPGTGETWADYAPEPYAPTVLMNGKMGQYAAGVNFEAFNRLTPSYRASYTTDGESAEVTLPVSEGDVAKSNFQVVLYNGDGETKTFIVQPEMGKEFAGATVNGERASCTYDGAGTVTFDTAPPAPSYNEYNVAIYFGTGPVVELSLAYNGNVKTYVAGLTDAGTQATGWVYVDPNYFEAPTYSAIKLVMGVNYRTRMLDFYTVRWIGGSEAPENSGILPRVYTNNLTVTAQTKTSDLVKVCRMTRKAWFGGYRSGISGGTRLFLCGNPDEPNLVIWSAVNNPLYYPENNYAYVGDKFQRVTGFGKQDNMLVIFKEREIYAMTYTTGDVTAEDVQNGVDMEATVAQFPMMQIHSTIGCDCPDTVRLVNNRLVWATSDKAIYMLPNINQYSERNVRMISDAIEDRLKVHDAEDFTKAKSGELAGHFVLFIGREAFVLDCDVNAFTYYASYGTTQNVKRLLPWFIWDIVPEAGDIATFPTGYTLTGVCSTGEQMEIVLSGRYAADSSTRTRRFGLDESLRKDDVTIYGTPAERDIPCMMQGKLFDFGEQARRKTVVAAYIEIADMANGDLPATVKVYTVTEEGTREQTKRLIQRGDRTEDEPGWVTEKRITPNVSRARIFGIRLESDTPFAVGKMKLTYKTQGTVR